MDIYFNPKNHTKREIKLFYRQLAETLKVGEDDATIIIVNVTPKQLKKLRIAALEDE